MNPICPELITGTIGELLVQLRLLQYGVQAAPPIKDSGNDLIAIRRRAFRAIQVKARTGDLLHLGKLPELYDIVAAVQLAGDGNQLFLDESHIFLIPREVVADISPRFSDLEKFILNQDTVDKLFEQPHV